jgi:hypothetical protein
MEAGLASAGSTCSVLMFRRYWSMHDPTPDLEVLQHRLILSTNPHNSAPTTHCNTSARSAIDAGDRTGQALVKGRATTAQSRRCNVIPLGLGRACRWRRASRLRDREPTRGIFRRAACFCFSSTTSTPCFNCANRHPRCRLGIHRPPHERLHLPTPPHTRAHTP